MLLTIFNIVIWRIPRDPHGITQKKKKNIKKRKSSIHVTPDPRTTSTSFCYINVCVDRKKILEQEYGRAYIL